MSKTKAWERARVYAATIREMGVTGSCGVTVERRRLPGTYPGGRARYVYDVLLCHYGPGT